MSAYQTDALTENEGEKGIAVPSVTAGNRCNQPLISTISEGVIIETCVNVRNVSGEGQE